MTQQRERHLGTMWLIRLLEERIRELRLADEVAGSVHLYIGQEAIAAGACAALRPGDRVFATYRGHGWAIARGVPAARLLAELLGRETGLNGGRGGSAYFTAPRWDFYGENSIVGAGAPIAAGAALAAKREGAGRVALCAFGDGAMNQGSLHEALNFAAVYDLPVVYVCENNKYSELTPIADMVKVPELWRRAAAYGMPGERVDGNDPVAVQQAVAAAVERARQGQGPALIEAMTERLVGHYIGDVEQYRPAGEVDAARKREPIARAVRELAGAGLPGNVLDEIERVARAEIDQATELARSAPPADSSRVREHVYA